jgi:dTDP-4-dehydrorhamnose reductase
MVNIVVLGGSGYIASKIKKYWTNEEFNLIYFSLKDVNYLDLYEFKKIIEESNAKYIINCYGYTGKPNVDSCEINKEDCHQRNVKDNLWIHENSPIPVITISSGCIYNDDSGRVKYTEDDPHNFGRNNPTASFYSKSKSLFEDEVKKHTERDFILRIRMPFDGDLDDDKNYIGKILRYNKRVNYKNSLTHLEDLTKFIEIILTGSVPAGIYNVVNEGGISTYDILAIKDNNTFDPINNWYPFIDESFLSVDDMLSQGFMKCRRSNCVLSTDKIKKYYNIPKAIDRVREVLSTK